MSVHMSTYTDVIKKEGKKHRAEIPFSEAIGYIHEFEITHNWGLISPIKFLIPISRSAHLHRGSTFLKKKIHGEMPTSFGRFKLNIAR